MFYYLPSPWHEQKLWVMKTTKNMYYVEGIAEPKKASLSI